MAKRKFLVNGQQLLNLRVDAQIHSVKDLAERTDLNEKTISRLERYGGEVKLETARRLANPLAQPLGLSVDEVLHRMGSYLPVTEAHEVRTKAVVLSNDTPGDEPQPREKTAPPAVPEPSVDAFETYRKLWSEEGSLKQKIARASAQFGSLFGPVNLEYSVRIAVDHDGNARFDFERVICNLGRNPVASLMHSFWFDTSQDRLKFRAPGHAIGMVEDEASFKRFFVNFSQPVNRGDVMYYRYGFVGRRMYSSENKPAFWELHQTTVTNHVVFQLTHQEIEGLKPVKVSRIGESGEEPVIEPRPAVYEGLHGVMIQWQMAFPRYRDIYKVQWK